MRYAGVLIAAVVAVCASQARAEDCNAALAKDVDLISSSTFLRYLYFQQIDKANYGEASKDASFDATIKAVSGSGDYAENRAWSDSLKSQTGIDFTSDQKISALTSHLSENGLKAYQACLFLQEAGIKAWAIPSANPEVVVIRVLWKPALGAELKSLAVRSVSGAKAPKVIDTPTVNGTIDIAFTRTAGSAFDATLVGQLKAGGSISASVAVPYPVEFTSFTIDRSSRDAASLKANGELRPYGGCGQIGSCNGGKTDLGYILSPTAGFFVSLPWVKASTQVEQAAGSCGGRISNENMMPTPTGITGTARFSWEGGCGGGGIVVITWKDEFVLAKSGAKVLNAVIPVEVKDQIQKQAEAKATAKAVF